MRAWTHLLLALLGGCTSGPRPPSGWSGPFDVATVLARATEAAGGPAALEVPATLHARWRVVFLRPEGPLEGQMASFAQGQSRERREVVTEDGHVLIQVIDGDRTLELANGIPTGRDLSPDAASRRRYRRLLASFAEPGAPPARLIDEPLSDPERALVLQREFAPDEAWQLWLDARSLLVIRIRCLTHRSGNLQIEEDFLSGHALFGTRLVPRHAVTWIDGRKVKETWLLEYTEDVVLEDELFALGG